MSQYDELHARHAVLEVKFAASMKGMDDGRAGDMRELARKLAEIEAEIKAHSDHSDYVASLIKAGATIEARRWNK